MPRREDDFSPTTIRELKLRVGTRCSMCRRSTTGPRIGAKGVINLGVAAHVTAASKDGPRYDSSLTSEERRDASNGIWLCQTCAKLVDNDVYRFSASDIRELKYLAERAARDELPSAESQWQTPEPRYIVCAFDLDGTLLRGPGFKYSWQLIWHYLGYEDGVRRRLFARYLSQEISYEEWCKECLFFFRQAQLNRDAFPSIARRLTITRNLERAIDLLRHEGLAVGIVSGGVDAVLGAAIPDYTDFFDFVYINRFIFDERGRLADVLPTPYDFARKAIALRLECERRHASLRNGVFVGEGQNDGYAIAEIRGQGGLTVAYPPNSAEVELGADLTVWEDDLMLVASAILARLG